MRSRATARFWKCFEGLPDHVQRLAEKNYALWKEDPRHPSLDSKQLRGGGQRFSVRVGLQYRALGKMIAADEVEWVWIGSHAEYDRLIR